MAAVPGEVRVAPLELRRHLQRDAAIVVEGHQLVEREAEVQLAVGRVRERVPVARVLRQRGHDTLDQVVVGNQQFAAVLHRTFTALEVCRCPLHRDPHLRWHKARAIARLPLVDFRVIFRRQVMRLRLESVDGVRARVLLSNIVQPHHLIYSR